jgi:hypothetical protein
MDFIPILCPHTPKWTPTLGIGSPYGVPNLQRVILKVKTHWFKDFFTRWKTFVTKMSKMGLHGPFGYLKHKL